MLAPLNCCCCCGPRERGHTSLPSNSSTPPNTTGAPSSQDSSAPVWLVQSGVHKLAPPSEENFPNIQIAREAVRAYREAYARLGIYGAWSYKILNQQKTSVLEQG